MVASLYSLSQDCAPGDPHAIEIIACDSEFFLWYDFNMSGNCLRTFLYHTAMLANEIHHLKNIYSHWPLQTSSNTSSILGFFWNETDKIKNKSIYYTLQAMLLDQKSHLATHRKETLRLHLFFCLGLLETFYTLTENIFT